MYLVQPPTGNFRTLFFKGDPAGVRPHRTPSAWLDPTSNRIVLRVSTEFEADLGESVVVVVVVSTCQDFSIESRLFGMQSDY